MEHILPSYHLIYLTIVSLHLLHSYLCKVQLVLSGSTARVVNQTVASQCSTLFTWAWKGPPPASRFV